MLKKFTLLCLSIAMGSGLLFAGTPGKRNAAPGSATYPIGKITPHHHKSAKVADTGASASGVTTFNKNRIARMPLALRQNANPSRIGASGATVYGYIGYDETGDYNVGINEMFLDGSLQFITDNLPVHLTTPSPYVIYMRNGNFCIIASELAGWFNFGTYFYEIAPDGKLIQETKYGDDDYYFNAGAGYDPISDTLYGFIEASNGLFFATAPGNNPTDVTIVGQSNITGLVAMTYNQSNGKIIAIQAEGAGNGIYEVNPTSGNGTLVATLERSSDYTTGLAYSPMDDGYYFPICSDTDNQLLLLDPNTFQTISSADYTGCVEFYCMYCPDLQKVLPNAPGEASLVSYDFPNAQLNGTVTYQLPALTKGGTPILGSIDWELLIDDQALYRGSAAAGSKVTIKVNDLTEGLHLFNFKESLAGVYGKYLYDHIYVGNDTPKAPANVTLTPETITWDAVTEGVHDGYVNPEEVTYDVYLNDEPIQKGLSQTECASEIPAGELLDSYVASVVAVYKGKESEPANSNDLAYGTPYSIPVTFEPTEKESRVFTVYDSNGDDNTIIFDYRWDNTPMFLYQYSSTEDADEWLFLPAISFTDSKIAYQFSMNAFKSQIYEESFEVKLCTSPTPSSVVGTIMPTTSLTTDTDLDSKEWLKDIYSGYFYVPEAGTYYVGIHVNSPADAYYLFMREFSVQAISGVSVEAPAEVTDLKATAGAGGELNATVTFKLPTTRFNGEAYTDNGLISVKAQAEGCKAVTAMGAPGSEVSMVVPTLQGDNKVGVTPFSGTLLGPTSYVNVYTGNERPGVVTNLTANLTDNPYTATLSWDAPAEGADGGYCDPTGITYYLCEYMNGGWYITNEIGTDIFTYDYTVTNGSSQQLYNLGIIAVNSIGMADYLQIAGTVIGKPYETPAICNVPAGQILQPVVGWDDFSLNIGNPSKYYSDFTTDDNVNAIFSIASSELEDAYISLPLIATDKTSAPALKLDIYGGSCDFDVVAKASDIEETVIKSYSVTDFTTPGRQTLLLELPAQFAGKDWIEIGVKADISTTQSFILYGFRVYDNVGFDFGVTAIDVPTSVTIGQQTTFTAYVTNLGNTAYAVPAGVWTLTDSDGNVVASVNVDAGTTPIEPEAEVTYEISFTPNAEQLGTMTIEYTLENADNKEYNNSYSATFNVAKGTTPVVTDLKATEVSYDHVSLAWTPLTSSDKVVESFEDVTPFVLDDVSDMIGQFTRVDGDGLKIYGSQADGFANIPGAYGPASYLVWSQSQVEQMLGSSGTFQAKTGDKFLIAFCPSEGKNGAIDAADDWLVSPQVEGGTKFGFSVRPITYQYGAEVIEVMYSTTGDKPADFTLLETLNVIGNTSTTVWHDYEFTLPIDAKYFAIHYVSKDIFGIMLDDILYTPAGSATTLTGYDIYRNGYMIETNEPCTDGTFTDTTVEESTNYTYMIMPVLDNGTRGLESNTVLVSTSGVSGMTSGAKAVYTTPGQIIVKGYEGAYIAVVATDGKIVASSNDASSTQCFLVSPGIYIVKAANDTVKVIVK